MHTLILFVGGWACASLLAGLVASGLWSRGFIEIGLFARANEELDNTERPFI